MSTLTGIREQIKGKSKNLRDAICKLERIALTKLPVLIQGETGTGKELAARLVHEQSGRTGPFIPINCACISETLAESILFGHKRGAFFGVQDNLRGLLESANGGTIFLDHIGEMPLLVQAMISRVLDYGTVEPLSNEIRPLDVRVVAAMNRDLETMVAEKAFRLDLYYCLKCSAVELPPLRDRGRDIIDLARYFLQHKYPSKRLTRGAEKLLLSHSWPGNIRELRRVIAMAAINSNSQRALQPKHILPCLVNNVCARDNNVCARDVEKRSRTDEVLGVIDRLRTAAPADIRAETSLAQKTLQRSLRKLVATGVLMRTGAGRGVRYLRPETPRTEEPATDLLPSKMPGREEETLSQAWPEDIRELCHVIEAAFEARRTLWPGHILFDNLDIKVRPGGQVDIQIQSAGQARCSDSACGSDESDAQTQPAELGGCLDSGHISRVGPQDVPDVEVGAGDSKRCSRADMILGVMDHLGAATPADIRAATLLAQKTLQRSLNSLIAAGVLKRIGAGRGTRYLRAETKDTPGSVLS